jgi:hypothetical protein
MSNKEPKRQIRFGYIYGIIGFYKDPKKISVFSWDPASVTSYGYNENNHRIYLYKRDENEEMLKAFNKLRKQKTNLEFHIIRFTSKRAKIAFNIKNCSGYNNSSWVELELKKDIDFFKLKVYRALT